MNDELLSKLERLAKLKEQGALTQAEYEQQKTMLIGKLPQPPRVPQDNKFKWKWWHFVLIVFVGLPMIGIILEDRPPEKVLTPTEQAKADSTNAANESSRKIANDVDIADLKAVRAIKKILKDPDSFQEIDHRSGYVGKKGIYISCLVTYRAKNSFGGYGAEKALVNFDSEMRPINVVPVE